MGLLKLVTVAVLLCQMTGTRSQEQVSEYVTSLVQANNAFCMSLYQALRGEEGNLAVSPLSIHSMMSLAWLGAGGDTAQELATGLHLPQNRSIVESGFRTLLSSLQGNEAITLDIANKMYLQQGRRIKSTFRQTAVDNFRSGIQEVDFANDTETARTSINQWVEERTHNKIKDLIAPGTLDEATLLVVVNAIYFKGGWRKPFEESLTNTETFHLTSNSSVNVSMMHQTDFFSYDYIPSLKLKVLKILYRSSGDEQWSPSTSMLILLPDEATGLASLEANITSLNLTNIVRWMDFRTVVVSLPRFKIEKTLRLEETLQQLGITKLFQDGADLSGITDEDVVVNKVLQKTFVEVTEKGTEAAAASYFDIVLKRGYDSVAEFKADHPFLFLIMDGVSDAILFMGRVTDPS